MSRGDGATLGLGLLFLLGAVIGVLRYGDYRERMGEAQFRRAVHDSALAEWDRERSELLTRAEQAHGAADQIAAVEYQRRGEVARLRATNVGLRHRLDAALAALPETSIVVVGVDSLRAELDACRSALALCAARADSLGSAFRLMRGALEVETAAHDSTRRLWRTVENQLARASGRRQWDGVAIGAVAGGCAVGGYGLAEGHGTVAVAGFGLCAAGALLGWLF